MSRLPPWHMWGNSQTAIVDKSLAISIIQTTQILRVAYGRPETWDFLFRATIIDCNDPTDAGELDVNWNLTVGVGRSHVTLPQFERYVFQWTGMSPSLPVGMMKYSGQVETPVRDDSLTTPNPGVMTDIVAQDIQLQADLLFTGGATPIKQITVQLDAFFTPKVHIRPEWFKSEFPGEEDHGT